MDKAVLIAAITALLVSILALYGSVKNTIDLAEHKEEEDDTRDLHGADSNDTDS